MLAEENEPQVSVHEKMKCMDNGLPVWSQDLNSSKCFLKLNGILQDFLWEKFTKQYIQILLAQW